MFRVQKRNILTAHETWKTCVLSWKFNDLLFQGLFEIGSPDQSNWLSPYWLFLLKNAVIQWIRFKPLGHLCRRNENADRNTSSTIWMCNLGWRTSTSPRELIRWPRPRYMLHSSNYPISHNGNRLPVPRIRCKIDKPNSDVIHDRDKDSCFLLSRKPLLGDTCCYCN